MLLTQLGLGLVVINNYLGPFNVMLYMDIIKLLFRDVAKSQAVCLFHVAE